MEITVDLHADETCPAKAYLMRTRGISSGLWKRIKHSGTFAVNGVPAIAARTMLRAGDIVSYELPIVSSVTPEQLPLTIIYEDNDLLIIDKPAGQLVHPTTRELRGTVANAVLGLYAARGTALDFHPCHRLDRNTTGLLLIAKRPEVQHQIARANVLERRYLALIEGAISPAEGTIDAPIERALPSLRERITKQCGRTASTRSCGCALRRDAPIRSASTSRTLVIPCSAMISTAAAPHSSHVTPSTPRSSPSSTRAHGNA